MKVAAPREIVPGERRVALTPDVVRSLVRSGFEVSIEAGAGGGSYFPDESYADAGATVVADAASLWAEADCLLKVQKPAQNEALGKHEVELLREGAALIAPLQPLLNADLVRMLADRKVTSFSMDMIPRITRAQSMDALSSQSTVAGYKAVLIGAGELPKFLPMLTTAAGTIRPARVLVLGAGVAGLQAIATARRLGAIVEAFDTRPVVKEQVESLGARFLEIELEQEDAETAGGYAKELDEEAHRKEQELIAASVGDSDIVITTALIPGKPAPVLITEEAVANMRHGSVIVDLAAEMGGNCTLTQAGETVESGGVKVIGPLNLSSSMPAHASQLYSKNVANLLEDQVEEGQFKLDFEDEITKGTCITHDGRIVNVQVADSIQAPAGQS